MGTLGFCKKNVFSSRACNHVRSGIVPGYALGGSFALEIWVSGWGGPVCKIMAGRSGLQDLGLEIWFSKILAGEIWFARFRFGNLGLGDLGAMYTWGSVLDCHALYFAK